MLPAACCPCQERLEQQKKEKLEKGQEYNKDYKPQRSKVSSSDEAQHAHSEQHSGSAAFM
jgi:hypothetical protein